MRAMQGEEVIGMAPQHYRRDFEQEEFGVMTKQTELKKQAYASTLKSRALSVLIYLIDRSNKELDARFREKNKGQTSNLYTLVLFEGQPVSEASHGGDCDNYAGIEPSGEVSQEREDKLEQEVCQVEHISFDTLKKQEEIPETLMKCRTAN